MKKYLRSVALACLFTFGIHENVQADFTALAGWDSQLFPSYLIASAASKTPIFEIDDNHLGDPNGLLGVEIKAPHKNTPIEVTIECDDFLQTSRFVGVLPNKGETYSVFPKIKYRFDRLSQCVQATPATVTFTVKLGDSVAEEQSSTLTFRSVNDCPIQVVSGEEALDTSPTFAAYVNEQHPFLDKLLREALDIGVVDKFTGYQISEDEVIKQAYSIWDLLVARDVRYSSVTTTVAESDEITSQNIRLLEQTINNQQANCVDGSVLMVSILRKIDIDAVLVFVPGHCYVGIYLDPARTKLLGLETTLMGESLDWPEEVPDGLEAAVSEDLQDEYSWPSFVQALKIGTQNILENTKQFESNPDYRVIHVGDARKLGILPIPYRGHEEFLAIDFRTSETEENAVEAETQEDSEDGDSENESQWSDSEDE